MKEFILDLTYKDATIINSNDDIFTIPSNNLPNNSLSHHTINLSSYTSPYRSRYDKNNKFSTYNLIDHL